jgi:hypothetical protein
MTKLTITIAPLITCSTLFSIAPGHQLHARGNQLHARDESRACGMVSSSMLVDQDLLLECGGQSRNAFNGWFIEPFNVFSDVVFTDESIGFYMENGGDYTVSLTRKIETMADYPLLDMTLNVEAAENCFVNHIDLYASPDGRTWSAVPMDQNNYRAVIINADQSYKFLRFAINVSFKSHGYLQCSYFRLSGEQKPVIEESAETISEEKPFFVFCFNKSVSIETKTELPYDVIFYNLAGQAVYTEKNTGSTRIEHDLPEGTYVITIVQEGVICHTKKVIF